MDKSRPYASAFTSILVGVLSLIIYSSRAVGAPKFTCDYNDNGICDGADYVVWRNTYGQSIPPLPADGDQSNQIDAPDYNVWRVGFGSVFVGTGADDFSPSIAAPEPSSIGLVSLLLMQRLTFARRRTA